MDQDLTSGLLITVLSLLFIAPPIIVILRKHPILRNVALACMVGRLLAFCFWIYWAMPFFRDTSGLDSFGYDARGAVIADLLRHGAWENIPWGITTAGIDCYVGVIYALTGPNLDAMYLQAALLSVLTTLTFARTLLLFRPFRSAAFAIWLLTITPSFAFWTCIFGKDGWVAFGLALFSLGYARWLKEIPGVTVSLLAGLSVIAVVRPWIAFIVTLSALTANVFSVRPFHNRTLARRMMFKTVGLLVLSIGVGYFLVEYMGLTSVEQAVEQNNRSIVGNATGGSAVDFVLPTSPSDLILAIPTGMVNMLFRPFPWEATNINSLLAVGENLGILVLLVYIASTVASRLRALLRETYFRFCILMVLAVIALYATSPNLGLLSRMRIQMFPFLFSLVCHYGSVKMSRVDRFDRHWLAGSIPGLPKDTRGAKWLQAFESVGKRL